MLTAVAILCVLVLIAWALIRCYAGWRLWLHRRDERADSLESLASIDFEKTDMLSVHAPVATVRDQAGQVVPAAAPRIGYDHFVADLPNPDWSWKPKDARE